MILLLRNVSQLSQLSAGREKEAETPRRCRLVISR